MLFIRIIATKTKLLELFYISSGIRKSELISYMIVAKFIHRFSIR